MAGDQVSILAQSYYSVPAGSTVNTNWVSLTDLLTGMSGSGALTGTEGALTPSQIAGVGTNTSDLTSFTQQSPPSSGANAYVNYLLFDEQLRYLGGEVDPVQGSGGYTNHTLFSGSGSITVPKNGYIYVYCSNASNYPVYFDNLTVTHTPGPMLEETHYYPFGLTMAGISSKAANITANKKKYNGIEKEDDLDINIYDAQFRELDAQTGRWWQIDPVTDGYENLSPYASMYNNPLTYSDPLGDEGDACCWDEIKAVGSFVAGTIVGATVSVVDNVVPGSNLRGQVSSHFEGSGAAGRGYNFGQDLGDATTMVAGAAGTLLGGAGALGFGGVTLATGGGSSLITVPAGGASLLVAGISFNAMMKGADNLSQQKGRVDPGGNSSPGKRRENRIPDKGEPNSTQTNRPGTTTKKYGPDGNVQKEFNKGHTAKGTPKNEKKDHVHDYKPNPQNPTERGERMPGRAPKKNELKKDFNL